MFRHTYIALVAGVGGLFAEVAEELVQATFVVLVGIVDDGIGAVDVALLAVLVDDVWDEDLVDVEARTGVEDGGHLLDRDVVQHMFAAQEQEFLIDSIVVQMGVGGNLVLLEALEVGKESRIAAEQGDDDLLAIAVEAVQMVEVLLVAGEHDARVGLGFLVEVDVACHGEQAQGTIHRSGLQAVGSTELVDVELEGAVVGHAGLNLEEVGQALIDHADIVAFGVAVVDVVQEVGASIQGGQQIGRGGFAIATGSSCLLEILFGRRGEFDVDDGAHIGFVDAHTEGVGGDHGLDIAAHPCLLPFLLLLGLQSGMIESGRNILLVQCLGNGFGLVARTDIDDGGATLGEQVLQLGEDVVGMNDGIGEVGTDKRGLEDLIAATEMELLADVVDDGWRGSGGQGDAGHLLVGEELQQLLPELGDEQVGGTEVVAPLRDAMCLIDHQQADVQVGELHLEHLRVQALGRDIEEVVVLVDDLVVGLHDLLARHAHADEGGLDATFNEVVGLVLHERDEGRHYQGKTSERQARHLERDALAAARGEQSQGVVPGKNGGYNILLQWAEGIVAPVFLQYVMDVVIHERFA